MNAPPPPGKTIGAMTMGELEAEIKVLEARVKEGIATVFDATRLSDALTAMDHLRFHMQRIASQPSGLPDPPEPYRVTKIETPDVGHNFPASEPKPPKR